MIEKMRIKYQRMRFLFLFGKKKSKHSHIYGPFSIIKPNEFIFGRNLSINDYVYINASGGITLGENVSLSAGSKLISTKLNSLVMSEHINAKIIVGDNVQVGAGAIILPGVTITNNVIIGAGCIVSKSITEPGIYVGIPAKKIK